MNDRGITLIVVHPDTAIGESIARLLSNHDGWRLYHASNGGDAVRVALATMPRLVLLDPDLQGMDGVATIASLRAHGIMCPIVALLRQADCSAQWQARGYSGAVALDNGLQQIEPQLRALLEQPAP